ncbi:MAG: flagellar basal body-associated FliL family protein, partial [Desulfatirhabdiaceae bacterium]
KAKDGGNAQPGAKTEQPLIGPIFPLDNFIVNLSDQGGKRYLRITMALELSDVKIADVLTQRLPQVRDAILMILPAKKVDEMQSVEGKNALRTELMAKLNEMTGGGTIKTIYFTEFVIQ